MMPLSKHAACLAAYALLTFFLTACGGGASEQAVASGTTAAAKTLPADASAVGIKRIQGATLNADGPATTLTVRAYAQLANDVGAQMRVLVDGVEVGAVEVRATEPEDYRFSVPALQPGTKVDVVYFNDATVGGVNRNLFITQFSAGRTTVLPNASGVTFDRGSGAAALDGQDVLPGQTGLYWNGALRLTWPEPNLTSEVTVRASGKLADNTGPLMSLRVDGVVVGSVEVRASEPTDHVFAVPPLVAGSKLDVVFTNATIGRALNVHYLMANADAVPTVLLPTASGTLFDAGSGLAAFDGSTLQPGQTALVVNGALRLKWPTPNMTDTLTVRASGRLAANVGPIMQVRVDGVVLGAVEVRTTAAADFSFRTLPLKPGQRVDVVYTNDATVGNERRALKVGYAMAGKTVLLATDGALSASWPEANLTDTLIVRAKGSSAAGVWPIMQVLVDNIVVGSVDVRSADNADYVFAVPPMRAGRKVDVVYTNDSTIGGEDRNLFIAYLLSHKTFLLPSANGNIYDRGEAAAAFDGAETVAGSGSMFWPGALRTTWPDVNITDTVTVRASATLAGNVGALMTLWVDGVPVSSVDVRATTPVDYLMPTPTLKPGSQVAVALSNPGNIDGIDRRLNVAYLIAGSSYVTANSPGASVAGGVLRSAWPTANLTDTLTVRAYAAVAGDVGALMKVLVDGVEVASTEVRATQPEDYQIPVPTLKPGSKIDIAYTNDATVSGVDRNLFVVQLTAGNTYMLPTADGVTFDIGSGSAAFDGANTKPGAALMYTNGALRFSWPEPNLTDRLTVRASSVLAGAIGAAMTVRVDGVVVTNTEVRATEPTDYVLAIPRLAVGSKVDIAFTNAATVGATARSLRVAYLMAGTTVLLPNASGVSLDMGSGLAAFDNANVQPGQDLLNANGALRGKWPAPNMTDSFTVRASGRLAANVGPIMQVRVDGVVLGSVEVRATTPADFSFPTLPVKIGQQVDIVYTNDAIVGSEDRDLIVAYAITGKTVLQPTANGVTFDQGNGSGAFDGINVVAGRNKLNTNGALRTSWPEANLTDTLTVRAKGTLAGNVGPIMQVLVDGVMIGSVEVRSTDNADYVFAAPPMLPGRKLDLVYTNDGSVGGMDRNLFIAYVITRNTFLMPNAVGNTYDRGSRLAAFDGIDLVAASGNLFWDGALRATWPAPNITGNVTVRASATLAGNVGALMTLWVDGIPVSSVEVRSTTPIDYLMPTPPLKPGSQVAVIFSNRGAVGGVERQLNIGYMIADTSFVTPTTVGASYNSGDLRAAWPAANLNDSITVRAYATLANNIGAMVQVRVNGVIVSAFEVRATTPSDYNVITPRLQPGDKIDVAYINDSTVAGVDRNFFLQYIKTSLGTLVPTAPTTSTDLGAGEAAFDGQGVSAGTGALYDNGALRFIAPAAPAVDNNRAAKYAASRFLQQATFGPTVSEIDRLRAMGTTAWVAEQMALPITADYVSAIQTQYNLGDAYRPRGTQYNPGWVAQTFWRTAATSPDALRKRVAYALHQTLMVSQTDLNLYYHARAYASYLDMLNKHAFGNFRNLLEDIALSPAMGIYLSHMRNRPENAVTGRMPDENFAREVMQLFSIGLHELNTDGTPKLDGAGQPIETYTMDDVMALAKVFTGWSWALADNQLSEANFRFASPDYSVANDQRVDLQRMKAYPGLHSTLEKRLFTGKSNAVLIPTNSTAAESVRLALDALFKHPNVGPFIGRQLIQRLVSSQPSPAYVARVAAAFNNNGSGVRGDMAAVVRAVLLDSEALNPPASNIGKLREPVQRVAHWMRSFGANSASGQYLMAAELESLGERALYAPSVFGYYRPGFVPPNTVFSSTNTTVPEMQIVNESTTALWVNKALSMASTGLGGTPSAPDVTANLQPLVNLATAGDADGLIERLNMLLYAGRMSASLKQELMDAINGVIGANATAHLNRARLALFLALASPEYLVQH